MVQILAWSHQVQNEDGSLISLIGMTLEQRKAIANQLLTPNGGNSVVGKKFIDISKQ